MQSRLFAVFLAISFRFFHLLSQPGAASSDIVPLTFANICALAVTAGSYSSRLCRQVSGRAERRQRREERDRRRRRKAGAESSDLGSSPPAAVSHLAALTI